MDAVLASRMEVRHVMSHRVTSVSPTLPADELRDIMSKKKMRHLLVCDKSGKLIGIISDRDVSRGGGDVASDLMTASPFTVQPETPISLAVTQMIDKHISCLPVVDKAGTLRAVLTSTDLMMALQCSLQILHKLAAEIQSDGNEGSTPQIPIAESTPLQEEKLCWRKLVAWPPGPCV